MTNSKLFRRLASIVLGFESIVVILASLVLFGLRRLEPAVALGGGLAFLVLLVVSIALLRFRIGVILGSLVQLAMVAAGLLEPTMFFVGAIFVGMWLYCVVVARRLDSQSDNGRN